MAFWTYDMSVQKQGGDLVSYLVLSLSFRGAFCSHNLGPLILSEGNVSANQYNAPLCYHLYFLKGVVFLDNHVFKKKRRHLMLMSMRMM